MKIEVTQGKFRINSVDVIKRGWGILILSVDCHSKYPGDFAWGGSSILVMPGERSLHLDETAEILTLIDLPDKYKDWDFVVTGSRYTITIVAYKHRRRLGWKLAWLDKSQSEEEK